ncbi:hypothetical protein IMSHALPRED_010496 [Imshaugia aleurites]|uniref:DUF7730 domain-containing protein n=1 Tax=Imshaugia aleurites TaxID=172621 RepID=A0A8H3IWZ5_9LECA|nr:hypothetical protein IMSHALPRED_010496 [Imshaugia aleurites]
MDNAAKVDSFPFFKLPAELRNTIYRLVLVTGRILLIRDMHLQEFAEIQENRTSTYQSRTTYLPTDHVCSLKAWPLSTFKPCWMRDTGFGPTKTTYTLDKPGSIDATTIAMLSLNKQSRDEVASIFYGDNTFHFASMSSLTPFMRDRTVETRKYIQCLQLTLTVDDLKWDVIFTEYGRPASWNTAFSALLKLSHMNVRKVCVIIDDRKAQLLADNLNLQSRSMLWLHKLGRLKNLETLGLKHDIGPWQECQQHVGYWGAPNSTKEEEGTTETEQELWNFLAPKMLKKETGNHSPDVLQRRRIRDFCKPHNPCRRCITLDRHHFYYAPEDER